MAIHPVAPASPASPGIDFEPASGESGTGLFARVLGQALGHVNEQQARSQAAVRELAMGHMDNLHSFILEVSKGDLAFRLFLEVRNRLSDALQEVMRMSV